MKTQYGYMKQFMTGKSEAPQVHDNHAWDALFYKLHSFKDLKLQAVLGLLLLLVFLGAGLSAQAQEAYNLKDKPFYSNLFSADAFNDLDRAADKEARGQELEDKANERYRTANKALKRKKAATTSSSRNKANRRYKWKKFWADFHYKRALKRYNKADEMRFEVYDESIAPHRLNDDSKYDRKGHALENKARNLFLKGERSTDDLPSGRQAKIDALEKGDSLKRQALQKMKLAYGLYKKDSTAASQVFKEDAKEKAREKQKEETLPKVEVKAFETNYSLRTDKHVYRSIKGRILRKLDIDTAQQQKINRAYKLVSKGDSLYEAINKIYRDITRKQRLEKAVGQKAQKERLRSERRTLQAKAFEKMLQKAQHYTEANKMLYEVLHAHYHTGDTAKNTMAVQHARHMLKSARDSREKAGTLLKKAESKRFRSEKYRLMMAANEQLHLALQQLEAAFASEMDMQFASNKVGVVNVFQMATKQFSEAKPGETSESTPKAEKTKKGGFEFKTRYTYNNEGNPMKAEPVSGLVFRVQTGIMRELPQKAATFLPPVYYDTFKQTSFKRFYLGQYRTKEAAKLAQDTIRSELYSDAFVVPFLNGKRISEGYAAKLIEAGKLMSKAEYAKTRREELAAFGKASAKPETTDKAHVRGLLKNTKGLVFTIQLGIYEEVPHKSQLAGIDSVYRGQSPIGGRYTFGLYDTFEQAQKVRNEIATNGVKKAFVVAYNDGAWIDINKARGLYELKEEPQPEVAGTKQKTGDVIYRVQIGAFKERGRFAQLRKKMDIKEIPGKNDMITYTIGKFDDYSNALKKRDELLSKGIEGFVVAYKGKSRIALTEARQATKSTEKPQDTAEAKTTVASQDAAEKQPEVEFRVQVGAYSDALTSEQKQRFEQAADKWDLQMLRDDQGRYVYSLGSFGYYEKALDFRQKLEEKGVEGFVVAYKGKQKLSLDAARKMK